MTSTQKVSLSPIAMMQAVLGHEAQSFHRQWFQDLLDPAIERLLIIAPPGSGKTTICGVVYPAWLIGQNSDIHIGYVSAVYAQAARQSVAVRDIVENSPLYQMLYPRALPAKDKGWAEAEWFVQQSNPGDKDATFRATGLGGPLLGARLDVLIIDDFSTPENTATTEQRQKSWDWLMSVGLSRLGPAGKAVAIQTRWHEEDVAGRMEALGWTVRKYPAILPDGQSLWPSVMPLEYLAQQKVNLGIRGFEMVYQGVVTPLEGGILKATWFPLYSMLDRRPHPKAVIQSWDCAHETGAANDFSVGTTWEIQENGYPLTGLYRRKVDFPQLLRDVPAEYEAARNQTGQYPKFVLIEVKDVGSPLYQQLKNTTRLPLIPLQAIARDSQRGIRSVTKRMRLEAVAPMVEAGKVMLPKEAPWLQDYLYELTTYPGAAHDDMVDSTSQFLNWVREYELRLAPRPAPVGYGRMA